MPASGVTAPAAGVMQTRPATALAALITLLFITACGPLIGAGAVVGADEIAEEDNGGDGLY